MSLIASIATDAAGQRSNFLEAAVAINNTIRANHYHRAELDSDVYLQIEKIRFEDKLTYQIHVDEKLNHYLVPRFVIQPLVENAVKHGLKATGQLTEINLGVTEDGDGIVMNIADTGPLFPEELNPGYGVKSVYDKLDLLFAGNYEIRFSNTPSKRVSIHLKKRIKNEAAV